MAATLFFYDLETSGIYADSDRIMQFAGQRTDLDLKAIGEPVNVLIRLNEDVLPDPAAVLIHGISPQQTISEGLTEAEFLRLFYTEIATAETTFVGFNNVRFDDEFLRFLNYRNLYDPYAWSYEHNSSRWDILDVVRMTRALRPEGINWPVDELSGANTNRLGLLAKANKLKHEAAHDALSDVLVTIDVARLIKKHQPKLYAYLFEARLKANAAKLVNSAQPFIYTSSHYPSAQLHTTAVLKVADHPSENCALVYDLRYDPAQWLDKDAEALADSWRYIKDRPKDNPALPVKTLRLNRCPAIAPLGTLDAAAEQRLQLDPKLIEQNYKRITAEQPAFAKRLIAAVEMMNAEQEVRQRQRRLLPDAQLYQGFFSDHDRQIMKELHDGETADKIRGLRKKFSDHRLQQLCSFYLARNYKGELSTDERTKWDAYLERRLFAGEQNSRLAVYFQRIAQLAGERSDSKSQVLLEDLKLYGESLVPSYVGD